MSENEEDFEIYRCVECDTDFSNELITKVKQNRRNLFCECCGKKIIRRDLASRIPPTTNNIGAPQSNRNPEKSIVKEKINLPGSGVAKKVENSPEVLLTKEGIVRQFNIFVVRRAYEVLKEFQYDIEMEKDQKEPDSYQLKELAGILRKKIALLPFEKDWLAGLSPKNLENFKFYCKNIKEIMNNKKFYRKHYKEFFQETLLSVYRLIKGLPDESIEKQKRLDVLFDLKDVFGFALYLNARDTFEFQLTAFLASEIYYSKTFRESVLQCDKFSEEIDKVIGTFALELYRSLDQPKFLYKYADRLKWKYKVKFKIKLNNLSDEAREDHVFCESFVDYLKWLTRTVFELVRGVEYSKLDDMQRDILEFLLSTRPFLSDRELQSSFVPSFKIVLCRMMRSEWSKKIRATTTKNGAKAFEDELIVKLTPEKIGREFLIDLSEISLDDFERNYGKFQLKLKRDEIYRAGFNQYLYFLVKATIKLIRGNYDPKTLSKSERVILQDLQKFKQTPAGKGELAPLNLDSLDKERSCGKTEESKALLTHAAELPDIEEIFIIDSDSKKHPVTAIIDTGASIRECLLDIALATNLGLKIETNAQKSVLISGIELKGHPCTATIVFRNTPMTIEFLAIEKLQESVLNYYGLVSFPALISKPTLLMYSELTGQDGKIVLDLKDQCVEDQFIMQIKDSLRELTEMKMGTSTGIPIVAITKNEMYLADTIRLPHSIELSHLCHLSNNLKNTGNYYLRDFYFSRTKQNYMSKMDYGQGTLGYYKLWNIVKGTRDYKAMPPGSAEQSLRILEHDWKSYRENLKAWEEEKKKNPDNCRGKPQIPYYNMKFNRETVAVFTNQHCKIVDGWLIFQKKGKKADAPHWLPRIKTKFPSLGTLHQVRIVPRGSCYDIEIVYSVPKKNLYLNKTRAIALDLGSTNLLATANNCGLRPFIVKGGVVRTVNQVYNKLIKRYQSVEIIKEQFFRKYRKKPKWNDIKKLLPEYKTERQLKRTLREQFYQKNKRYPNYVELNECFNAETEKDLTANSGKDRQWTMQMYRILAKRNNRIKDIFHKTSRNLITYCISNNIGTIFIGHNKGWKQGINIGRRNNQNFVSIPFNKLIQQIKYKAELVGINVIEISESHTSKCSALDNESIEHHDKYLGKRVCRGLFRSANGYYINADINAALNILRRGLETLGLSFSLDVSTMLRSPRSIVPIVKKAKVNPIA